MPLDARVTTRSAATGFGPRLVLLPGEMKRLEVDLDALPHLVAGAEPELAKVEGGHSATVARPCERYFERSTIDCAIACSVAAVVASGGRDVDPCSVDDELEHALHTGIVDPDRWDTVQVDELSALMRIRGRVLDHSLVRGR